MFPIKFSYKQWCWCGGARDKFFMLPQAARILLILQFYISKVKTHAERRTSINLLYLDIFISFIVERKEEEIEIYFFWATLFS